MLLLNDTNIIFSLFMCIEQLNGDFYNDISKWFDVVIYLKYYYLTNYLATGMKIINSRLLNAATIYISNI